MKELFDRLWILFMCMMAQSALSAQTVSVSLPAVHSTVCVGDVISVPFNASAGFIPGNEFRCYMSGTNGDWSWPQLIGTANVAWSSQIICTFTTPFQGNQGVQLRIESTDPPTVGPASAATFAISVPANVGFTGNFAVCTTDAPFDLHTGVAPNATSLSYLDPLMQPFSGTFDPATDMAGCYTVLANSYQPCAADTGQSCVTILPSGNAGTAIPFSACMIGDTIALHDQLTGEDPGGIWTDPNGQLTDSLFYTGTSLIGCYQYFVSHNNSCPTDWVSLCVSADQNGAAGRDTSIVVCPGGLPFTLLDSLPGSPANNGTWVDATTGLLHNGVFIPGVDSSTCYYYVVPPNGQCAGDTAMLCLDSTPCSTTSIAGQEELRPPLRLLSHHGSAYPSFMISNLSSSDQLLVRDLTGRIVLIKRDHQRGKNVRLELNLSALPSGQYLFSKTGPGETISIPFAVIR